MTAAVNSLFLWCLNSSYCELFLVSTLSEIDELPVSEVPDGPWLVCVRLNRSINCSRHLRGDDCVAVMKQH